VPILARKEYPSEEFHSVPPLLLLLPPLKYPLMASHVNSMLVPEKLSFPAGHVLTHAQTPKLSLCPLVRLPTQPLNRSVLAYLYLSAPSFFCSTSMFLALELGLALLSPACEPSCAFVSYFHQPCHGRRLVRPCRHWTPLCMMFVLTSACTAPMTQLVAATYLP
jgi:hypothetical protein